MIRLTRAQVREVDRLAIEKYHMPGIVLMENAARGAAEAAWEMAGDVLPYFIVLCGGGNNGGDGYAIARQLKNRGSIVWILSWTDPEQLTGDALTNYRITEAMNLPKLHKHQVIDFATLLAMYDTEGSPIAGRAVIIDAVFGTGLTSAPREPFNKLVDMVGSTGIKLLSVDLPSGLDCDTGLPLGPCVRATKTVTFVAEKAGFANPASKQYTGEVIVADIGCPREIIDEVLRTMPAS